MFSYISKSFKRRLTSWILVMAMILPSMFAFSGCVVADFNKSLSVTVDNSFKATATINIKFTRIEENADLDSIYLLYAVTDEEVVQLKGMGNGGKLVADAQFANDYIASHPDLGYKFDISDEEVAAFISNYSNNDSFTKQFEITLPDSVEGKEVMFIAVYEGKDVFGSVNSGCYLSNTCVVNPQHQPVYVNVKAGEGSGHDYSFALEKWENGVSQYEVPQCSFGAPSGMKFSCWQGSKKDLANPVKLLPGDTWEISRNDSEVVLTALWEEIDAPADNPADNPADIPSDVPDDNPSDVPSDVPDDNPSDVPSDNPAVIPTDVPTDIPTLIPTVVPTDNPNSAPSNIPTVTPSSPVSTKTPELDVGDFVDRCYVIALGRPADPEGYIYWCDMLNNGMACGTQVGYGFIFSEEYLSENKSDSQYVTDLYAMYFGREPDEAGFNYWVSLLENGNSRKDVFAGFANSEEFCNLCKQYGITAGYYLSGVPNDIQGGVNCFVSRLYRVCLNRLPDIGGQAGWVVKLLNNEVSGSTCAYGFVMSPEFANLGLNDTDYVCYMYRAFFGREADAEGLNYWVGKLNEDTSSREDIFYGFSGSEEFANLCSGYGIIA